MVLWEGISSRDRFLMAYPLKTTRYLHKITLQPLSKDFMSDTQSAPPLPIIIEISKIDVQIAGLLAQQKSIETERVIRKQALDVQTLKRNARVKILEEKRAINLREEKSVKIERERINERRRALNTLNNYKLQQAAEREIEFVAKQIGQREDLLLGLMREVEILERDIAEIDGVVKGLQEEGAAFEREAELTLQTVGTSLGECNEERAQQVTLIGNNSALIIYNRVRDRFPMNPVVALINRDTCSGCHMKVGPQVIVQISRGDVVKCPGCGRLLKLSAE